MLSRFICLVFISFTLLPLRAFSIELKASKVATDTFKRDYSEDFYRTINAVQLAKVGGGTRVRLYYKLGEEPKMIDYFCHYHTPTEMDCHDL